MNVQVGRNALDERTRASGMRYGWITPDYVTTLAYNAHTAEDPRQRNILTKSAAGREVALFLSITEPLINPDGSVNLEGVYLHRVRIEFISLAHAISREKNEYIEDAIETAKQYAEEEKSFRQSLWSRAFAAFTNRMMAMAGLGTVGASLMLSFLPRLSSTNSFKGTTAVVATLAATAMGALFGKLWSDWMRDSKKNRLAAAKELRTKMDRKLHNEARLHQIRDHLTRLHEIWLTYTGVKFWIPIEASCKVIADEMETGERLDREFAELTLAPWKLFIAMCARRAALSFKKRRKQTYEG
jgi:hypothetical protein